MILMVNMWGYFLGHYPQHFTLTDEQRNLILQTMMFFLWLAGGAAVFQAVEGWTYPDALYFCDVTILTIGFGDFYPTDDLGRGLVFPYSVGGMIILGLMVSSIHKFAGELSTDNVFRKHVERHRVNTLSRAVTQSEDNAKRDELEKRMANDPSYRPSISSPLNTSWTKRSAVSPLSPNDVVDAETPVDPEGSPTSPLASAGTRDFAHRQVDFEDVDAAKEKDRQDDSHDDTGNGNGKDSEPSAYQFLSSAFRTETLTKTLRVFASPLMQLKIVPTRPHKSIIMKEEKDRFDAMRAIQANAATFKKWYALTISVIAFAILWCVGAVAFWQLERKTQQLSYFQALYFAYVSLLTIGYGDLSPRSNAGKPFFVVWSLIAVPTMTILISDMGDTVIAKFKEGTFRLADFTVLPKQGLYRDIMQANPRLWNWLQRRSEAKRRKKGLPVGPDPNDEYFPKPTIEQLASEDLNEAELTRQLAFAIRKTADDLKLHEPKRYSYEEWVEFTRLIRFTQPGGIAELKRDENAEGIVEWDWLDQNSPMLSEQNESEWVLDRLCESLLRCLKKNRLGFDDHHRPPKRLPGGFVPFSFSRRDRRRSDEGEFDPAARPDGTMMSQPKPDEPAEPEPTKAQLRRRRASGADAMLTFFTGERRGTNAYATSDPQWSKKAIERMHDRRRSSASNYQARKGPFAVLGPGGRTGAVGGGRGGAGTKTLKARYFTGSVDRTTSGP